MGKTIDITGQKFGDLTVIKQTPAPNPNNRHTFWLCKCSCGNDYTVVGTNLRNGTTTCCKNCSAKNGAKKLQKKYDITGQKFGKLTVIKKLEERTKDQSCYIFMPM